MFDITPNIISVNLINGGDTLQVIKRHPNNVMYTSNPTIPVPDKLTKEIYSVVDAKIVLTKTIEGKVTPQQIIPERFEFDE